MEDYPGSPPFPANVRVPENDDEPSFTIFRAGLVDLADRTAWLSVFSPIVGAQHISFMQGNPILGDYTSWSIVPDFGGIVPNVLLQGVANNTSWVIDVTNMFPPGTTMAGLSFRVQGSFASATHGVNMPLHMPEFKFFVCDSNGVGLAAYTASDSSADAATYEAVHPVDINLSSTPVNLTNTTNRFLILITGEWGTNALAASFSLHTVQAILGLEAGL